jgi:hypothetical protein
MASKKLKSAIATVQKQDVKIQQMILDASLRANGLAAAKRKAENQDKYEAGGQVKKTRLWKLDLETRQGAFFFLADLCDDPAFLEACRKRAKTEDARRGWSAANGQIAFTGSAATAQSQTEPAVSKPDPMPTRATGPARGVSSAAQQMTVRFRGQIPSGHKLRALGLYYDRDLEQWYGAAVREAVEEEIAGFRHLLLSIEIAAGDDTGQTVSGGPSGGAAAGPGAAKGWNEPLGFVVELEN